MYIDNGRLHLPVVYNLILIVRSNNAEMTEILINNNLDKRE